MLIPVSGLAVFIRRIGRALGYIVRGDFKGLRDRMAFLRRESAIAGPKAFGGQASEICWGILSPGHTLFVAHLLAEHLSAHGWRAEIFSELPESAVHDLYIVICPQVFKQLPAGEKRVVLQMEQSVSSRWFTRKYFETLKTSLAVLEYSLANMEFLQENGVVYPHVYYLPIGCSKTYGADMPTAPKKYDVLFYGDSLSSPRRVSMLNAVRQKFSVHVVNDLFGSNMMQTIKSARLVLNIHYYENALLEMPRIQECLSLGVPVVSESSADQADYPELGDAVIFFETGSIEAMVAAIEQALTRHDAKLQQAVSESQRRFAFMLDRFLVAMRILPVTHVESMRLPLSGGASTFGLSLPETIDRRKTYNETRPSDCRTFDGIRCRPGWVGCGLSYQALARHALDHGHSRITVMEDDVLLPLEYARTLRVINEYLNAKSGGWDVFAGVIAILHPETRILAVEEYAGHTFVTINKMTSMVFNIYAESALRLLLEWDPTNANAETNTIDRFIENQRDITVITMLPYFVGHREELKSTLWGFENSQYMDMISRSAHELMAKVQEFSGKQKDGGLVDVSRTAI